MMKRILSTILVVICVVMCTACCKDEPYIEPSVTVDEMLEMLSNEGYTINLNENNSLEDEYIEQSTKSRLWFYTNDNGYIDRVYLECYNFTDNEKDFLRTVWIKLLKDKALVGELIFDLRSEEYLQNETLSEIERGNLSVSYFTTEKLNSTLDSSKDNVHEISLKISEK